MQPEDRLPDALDTSTQEPWNDYKYTDLTEKNEIRVISLKSYSLDDKPLRCSITHVNPLGSRTYDAISYVWNEETAVGPLMPIHCDEGRFFITSNLYNAMRTIWRIFRSSPLWVDQICINQASDMEKNHQVALMSKIYQQADCVHVWLGGPPKDSIRFYSEPSLHPSWYFNDDIHWEKELKHLGRSERMTDRAWFHRIWTVQEIVMATNARVWCGNQSKNWDEYVENHEKVSVNLPMEWHEPALSELRLLRQRANEKTTLSELIILTRERDSSDPRDKVFALLGLTMEQGALVADYTMDVSDVYINAAKHCIEREKDLRILCTSRTEDQNNMNLPSWVPNLTSGVHTGDVLSVPFYEAEVYRHPHRRCVAIGGAVLGTIMEFISNLKSGQVKDAPRSDGGWGTYCEDKESGLPNLIRSRSAETISIGDIRAKPFKQDPYPIREHRDGPDSGQRRVQQSVGLAAVRVAGRLDSVDHTLSVLEQEIASWVPLDVRGDDILCFFWGKPRLVALRLAGIGMNVVGLDKSKLIKLTQYYEVIGQSSRSIFEEYKGEEPEFSSELTLEKVLDGGHESKPWLSSCRQCEREKPRKMEKFWIFSPPLRDSPRIVRTVFHLR